MHTYNYQCKVGHKHVTQRGAKNCHHCKGKALWALADYNRYQTTRYTIPENIHPWIKFLFVEAKKQRCSFESLAKRSGVTVGTIRNWRDRALPNIANYEACLNSLGYKIKFVPIHTLIAPYKKGL